MSIGRSLCDNKAMRRLCLTLPTPAENLALDEALLDWAEDESADWEFLRIWESPRPMVVVGRSSRVDQEVDRAACRAQGIPILRRSSGGAAIVAGAGCLMYALVLSYGRRPELKDIRAAHAYVLDRLARSLCAAGLPVEHAGTSDLVLERGIRSSHSGSSLLAPRSPLLPPRKFSGNSLRAKRSHLLYHGTLLYDFDVSLVETCLRMPPRQPDYRRQRAHRDFLLNMPLSRQAIADAVERAWPAESDLADWPRAKVAELVAQRFSRDAWNLEFV